jgi:hypothetical protein
MCTPPNKKVCFEKRFAEGGSYTLFGPHMIESDPDAPEPADKTWYFCKARQGKFPIPRGSMEIAEVKMSRIQSNYTAPQPMHDHETCTYLYCAYFIPFK